MTEFMMGSVAAGKISTGDATSPSLPEPKELKFDLDDQSKKDIKTALSNFDQLMEQHELEVCFPSERVLSVLKYI
jgi:hypothetical protein